VIPNAIAYISYMWIYIVYNMCVSVWVKLAWHDEQSKTLLGVLNSI